MPLSTGGQLHDFFHQKEAWTKTHRPPQKILGKPKTAHSAAYHEFKSANLPTIEIRTTRRSKIITTTKKTNIN